LCCPGGRFAQKKNPAGELVQLKTTIKGFHEGVMVAYL
jgi:hypothetical protein